MAAKQQPTMKECRKQAEILGIHRRYRSKDEYIKVIAVVTTGTPDVHVRDYLLRDEEVARLRRLYRNNSTTRARYVKSIAEQLFLRNLRSSLRKCGVTIGFRSKEQILDALCVLWFATTDDNMFYINEQITDEECPICSLAVATDDNKRFRCACQFWYHGACLDRWVCISPTCPTCRSV